MTTLVRIDVIADRYQVKSSTIRGWIAQGMIPVVRVGLRAIRFNIEAVDKALLHQIPAEHPLQQSQNQGD
jgi:excisionase family DNA binding protein